MLNLALNYAHQWPPRFAHSGIRPTGSLAVGAIADTFGANATVFVRGVITAAGAVFAAGLKGWT